MRPRPELTPDERVEIEGEVMANKSIRSIAGGVGRALAMIAICVKSIELRSAGGDIAKAAG
jgi:hypothetical protein